MVEDYVPVGVSDEHWPEHLPRYGVYPLVGDQCQFDEELYSGNDKVAATIAAKRNIKAHPLGVILLDKKASLGWVWREYPPLKAHPVQFQIHAGDLERRFKEWAESYLRQRRQ